MKSRVKLLVIFISIFVVILISRVYSLSISDNKHYQKLAYDNLSKTEIIKPVRGIIRDRNSLPLAINKLGFNIQIKPKLRGKQLSRLKKNLHLLTDMFPRLNYSDLLKRYQKDDSPYNHKPITVVDFIPYDDMIVQFVKLSMQNDIIVEPTSIRNYPYTDIAAHVIGYTGKTNKKEAKKNLDAKLIGYIGKSGIEKEYNKVLQGVLGEKEIKVSASNQEIKTLSYNAPYSNELTLTLDIELQKYIHQLFLGKSGSLIVMNAKNGEILAAGSFPEFDINMFVNGIDSKTWKKIIQDVNRPFTNKITQGLYPPGSSIKPLIALSYLNSKKITAHDRVNCKGHIEVGKYNRKFRCWKKDGHGSVNLKSAIKSSCDVYFYEGSLATGIKKLSKDLHRYGLGKKSGIDLPNEFIGTVPNREWKLKKYGQNWFVGDTINTSIGQGSFLVTPIQVAATTALIATGYQVQPHFAKKINNKKLSYSKEKIFNKFEESKLRLIRSGMFDVCYKDGGTAKWHINSKVHMAGKTGTAQVVGIAQDIKERLDEEEMEYFHRSQAWFTTYAPYENPKYVVTAIIEHGGHGGSAAGPLVSQVYNKMVELGYIDKKYIH
jgi:penicillin-binding protein 2